MFSDLLYYSQALVRIQSQINPMQSLKPSIYKICVKITAVKKYMLGLPIGFYPSGFPNSTFYIY